MQRVVLCDGDYFEIACAVRADGLTTPVAQLLDLLERRSWHDPAAEALPDEYQVTIKRRFLAEIEHLAEYGEPAELCNHLREGVWELKIATLRVTFFDTDGQGGYAPKTTEPLLRFDGGATYPFPEDMDEFVRLGHFFGKNSRRTDVRDIETALAVREEDVAHDRCA